MSFAKTEKGGAVMQDVRNAIDKLVCRLDKQQKLVEIAHKGYVTTIRFLADGRVEIVNSAEKTA